VLLGNVESQHRHAAQLNTRAKGYSESFNSRMKAEFADREVFASLKEAKVLGADYKRYWNQEGLHSGIGYKTPAEFAAGLGPDSATLRPPQVPSPHPQALISTGT
jgi:transposase InsO family protein